MKAIEEAIPQRPPFLFLDEICELSEGQVTIVKTFSSEEPFYQGHFPGDPVTPGVYLCEIAFQSAAYLLGQEGSSDLISLVTRIQSCKFKKIVRPNQKIFCTTKLIEKIGPAAYLQSSLKVEDEIACTIHFACTQKARM